MKLRGWMTALLAALVASAVVVSAPSAAHSLPHGSMGSGGAPPAGVGEMGRRLLPAVDVADRRGYRFLNVRDDGDPVTFSPCRQWPVVVNPRGAPPGALRLVRQAVASVRRATGLSLVVTGRTAERVELGRPNYQPDRYGERWAPILVGWAATGRGLPAGRGGPAMARQLGQEPRYVSGVVIVDRHGTFNSRPNQVRALLKHELAHVAGLAHANDPQSLMYPVHHGQRRFSAADRAGLAGLGRGECTIDY